MGLFQDLKNFLREHFTSKGLEKAPERDLNDTPAAASVAEAEQSEQPATRTETDRTVTDEEADFLAYHEEQKAKGTPDIVPLNDIQGDSIVSCLQLSHVMRDENTSEGTMDVCFDRLQEMHNPQTSSAVIGTLVVKPEYLEQGIHSMRDNIAATPKSYLGNMKLLAHNMPDHIPEIMDILADMNDLSAVQSIGVIGMIHSEHAAKAIECLERMTPGEFDTYRSSDEKNTMGPVIMEDIIGGLEDKIAYDDSLDDTLNDMGVTLPDPPSDKDGLNL